MNTIASEKGRRYEMLVAEYYSKQGYSVIINGEYGDEQKSDNGVDLIAIKTKQIDLSIIPFEGVNMHSKIEVLLIQCKNHQRANANSQYIIKEEKIKEYIKKHKEYQKYRLEYNEDNHEIKSIMAVAESCVEGKAWAIYKEEAQHKDMAIIHLAVADNGKYVFKKEYKKGAN
ncbi:restriction endonuclease [uncultured Helicobacter sp.]|uniref:restriction endonuclease n=2 Tax=Helicobacter TaxID=209 RepID=UPI0026111089|nr:restriction endonuclease [uncultured Helicobacter sp.]